jgi:hypothetical protein
VPLGSVMNVNHINAADEVSHYNVYPAAMIQEDTIPILLRKSVSLFLWVWPVRMLS